MKTPLKSLPPFINKNKPFFGLIFFVFIAYLPLSSFLFAIKNDAFTYNFPNKYFFSEALQSGHIPYWNPYLNYGFPLFADPGFSWWHPLTWIFGFIGYTPFTFTIELLVYLIIAAVGMYCLGRQFALNRLSCFVMGALFTGSGFFVGNMQHINFLTCAAFLPWVVGTWWRMQSKPSLKNIFATVAATYLLCTAGHPAIPIGTIYFMCFLSLLYFFFNRQEQQLSSFVRLNITYLLLTAVFCLPALLAYAQLMPLYTRSQVVNHLSTDNLGFTIPSYISFLSPATTIKGTTFFATDVSMRNGYFSLFGFLALICVLIAQKSKTQKIFLGAGLVTLLLALGGWIKQLLYENLPLLMFIRTNGEFRVFALLSFIVCIGFVLNDLLANKKNIVVLKKVFTYAIIVFGLCVIACAVVILQKSNTGRLPIQICFKSGIKEVLDAITFPQTLLFGSLAGLFLASFYFIILKKGAGRFLHYFILADIILNAWLLLPITGVGQKSVSYIADKLNAGPKGFPFPSLIYNKNDKPVTHKDEQRIGNWAWYDKQIVHERIDYPSGLRSTENFYANSHGNLQAKPFLFLQHNRGTITILNFGPNGVEINVSLQQPDTVVLMQNKYPGWKVLVNNHSVAPIANTNPFLFVPLQSGIHSVSFRFSPAIH